jgi:ArsR family transcriptional regulator
MPDSRISWPAVLQSAISLDQVLKALSDPTRLEMMRLLGNTEDLCCRLVPSSPPDAPVVGLCVQDLVAHLQLPQSTVSHHLGMLRHVGLVRTQKNGQCVYYIRDDDAFTQVKAALDRL